MLEEGIAIGGKPLKDHLEAIGHAEAYDFLYTLVGNKHVQEKDIQYLHHSSIFVSMRKMLGNTDLPKLSSQVQNIHFLNLRLSLLS